MSNTSIEEIEEIIVEAGPEQQRELLTRLPHLLKFSPADFAFLKTSEPAFDFWNNSEDAIYDEL